MIKELVQFTENLSPEVRKRGIKPKEGLHILLKIDKENDTYFLDIINPPNIRYTKKMEGKMTDKEEELLEKLKMLQQNAWMVDTNKCLDAPAKGIHSASPFLIGFKPDFFEGGGKNSSRRSKNKKEIPERFQKYFSKAFDLFEEDERESLSQKYTVFKNFFLQEDSPVYYKTVLDKIVKENEQKTEELESEIKELKEQEKTADKSKKISLKDKISDKTEKLERYKPLSETDYILFYLDENLEKYEKPYKKYLADKLFNTSDFTTEPNAEGELFGTNNFRNGFNSSMPFLLHQTATFDISGRISDKEALLLNEFQSILPRKVLPNPLPIFIFDEERNKNIVSYFNENDGKVGYKEIIKNLIDSKNESEIGNYYLLFYQNTKDGLVFQDFDFVPKFDFYLKDEINSRNYWKVEDLFDVEEKYKINYSFSLENVFEFQDRIMKEMFSNELITTANKGKEDEKLIYKYFSDIDPSYSKSDKTLLLVLKYRKAFYDFVYKSQHTAISSNMFNNIMKTSIMEYIRLDETKFMKNGTPYRKNEKSIRMKMNIWFSLYEQFNKPSNTKPENTMASKVLDYREFVEQLANGTISKEDLKAATPEEFAFATGQVMAYLSNQSESKDKSYKRLEKHFQEKELDRLLRRIREDFVKYSHKDYHDKFRNVASFVLAYDDVDEQSEDKKKIVLRRLDHLILAGLLSDNLLYGSNRKKKEEATKENN